MASPTLDISEARKQFSKLGQRLQDERVIWITRHNKKAFAVVNTELLQTFLETMEIVKDPDTLQMLKEGLDDVRSGSLHDHEDVKSELLNESTGDDEMDGNSISTPEKPSAARARRPAERSR
jgi:PHD/YefM family antitoxin component YafN of YafNO toxin-antitoxin module